ncbi:SCO2400 family protein, partial [Streptomyces sp. NPDC003233]
MDYCHPCQRHLNGALACPGCGTPVPAAAEASAAYARAGTGGTPGYGVPPQYAEQYAQQYESQQYRIPQQYEPAGPEQVAWTEQPEPREDWDPGSGTEAAADGDPEPVSPSDPDPGPDTDQEPGGRAARRRARGSTTVSPADADASRRDRKAAAHRRRRRRTVLITAGFVLAAGSLGLAELGKDAPFSPFSSGQPDTAGDTAADGGASSASPGATADPASGTFSGRVLKRPPGTRTWPEP